MLYFAFIHEKLFWQCEYAEKLHTLNIIEIKINNGNQLSYLFEGTTEWYLWPCAI